eukprot:g5317.t1
MAQVTKLRALRDPFPPVLVLTWFVRRLSAAVLSHDEREFRLLGGYFQKLPSELALWKDEILSLGKALCRVDEEEDGPFRFSELMKQLETMIRSVQDGISVGEVDDGEFSPSASIDPIFFPREQLKDDLCDSLLELQRNAQTQMAGIRSGVLSCLPDISLASTLTKKKLQKIDDDLYMLESEKENEKVVSELNDGDDVDSEKWMREAAESTLESLLIDLSRIENSESVKTSEKLVFEKLHSFRCLWSDDTTDVVDATAHLVRVCNEISKLSVSEISDNYEERLEYFDEAVSKFHGVWVSYVSNEKTKTMIIDALTELRVGMLYHNFVSVEGFSQLSMMSDESDDDGKGNSLSVSATLCSVNTLCWKDDKRVMSELQSAANVFTYRCEQLWKLIIQFQPIIKRGALSAIEKILNRNEEEEKEKEGEQRGELTSDTESDADTAGFVSVEENMEEEDVLTTNEENALEKTSHIDEEINDKRETVTSSPVAHEMLEKRSTPQESPTSKENGIDTSCFSDSLLLQSAAKAAERMANRKSVTLTIEGEMLNAAQTEVSKVTQLGGFSPGKDPFSDMDEDGEEVDETYVKKMIPKDEKTDSTYFANMETIHLNESKNQKEINIESMLGSLPSVVDSRFQHLRVKCRVKRENSTDDDEVRFVMVDPTLSERDGVVQVATDLKAMKDKLSRKFGRSRRPRLQWVDKVGDVMVVLDEEDWLFFIRESLRRDLDTMPELHLDFPKVRNSRKLSLKGRAKERMEKVLVETKIYGRDDERRRKIRKRTIQIQNEMSEKKLTKDKIESEKRKKIRNRTNELKNEKAEAISRTKPKEQIEKNGLIASFVLGGTTVELQNK